MAVGKRPSPSAAPQEDWPCGVIGSGFTTQQRLRSPTAGVETPGLSCAKAGKTPSQRHLTLHNSYQTSRATWQRKPRRAIAAHAVLRARWLPCNVKRHHWGKALRALPLTPILGMVARQFSGVVALRQGGCPGGSSAWTRLRLQGSRCLDVQGGYRFSPEDNGLRRVLRLSPGSSVFAGGYRFSPEDNGFRRRITVFAGQSLGLAPGSMVIARFWGCRPRASPKGRSHCRTPACDGRPPVLGMVAR